MEIKEGDLVKWDGKDYIVLHYLGHEHPSKLFDKLFNPQQDIYHGVKYWTAMHFVLYEDYKSGITY